MTFNKDIGANPEQPLTIKGFDGYETFVERENIIGIRPKWNDVKDKFPEQGIVCLLYINYPPKTMFNMRTDPLPRNFIHIGGLRYDGKFISYENQYSEIGLEHVSHWMPLPSPPKE